MLLTFREIKNITKFNVLDTKRKTLKEKCANRPVHLSSTSLNRHHMATLDMAAMATECGKQDKNRTIR